MIILGIDPGLATLGYGVLEKDARGNVYARDYGVVLTPKEERLPTRLAILEEGINKLLDRCAPDEVAVEELFFSKTITVLYLLLGLKTSLIQGSLTFIATLFLYEPVQNVLMRIKDQ